MNVNLLFVSKICCLLFFGISFIVIFRAALIEKPPPPAPCTSEDVDFISAENGLVERFIEALKFKTITERRGVYNKEELSRFVEYIKKSFPKIHSSPIVQWQIINNYSLLYSIKGKDSSLKPYLLAGHLDVVPVVEENWEVDPFGGIIKDGFIYGRGTIDCKDVVMGILEAFEYLLENNFVPQRSIYIAFGHDEEGGGIHGASHISSFLASKGVKLEYLIDEGCFVINDLYPGVSVPVAAIGVAEKGQVIIELTVNGTAGHASMPPKETAINELAAAVSKLKGNVFPSRFGGFDEEMFKIMAPYASFRYKIIFSNLWLFKPLLTWFLGLNPVSSALIRTTTAVTKIHGGIKDNVIPSSATAAVNHRIHPSQSVQEVFDYVKYIINDNRIHMRILESSEPAPISPYTDDNFGFATIKKSIAQIYPTAAAIPMTLVANTDTKWYWNLTKGIYRFSPVQLSSPKEIARFHGDNERIAVKNYEQVVNFYYHLIKNSDESKLPMKHSHGEL